MITLYLAAYMQPENHGPGKKIAITDTKPNDFNVCGAFKPFIPQKELVDNYKKTQIEDQKKAGEEFVLGYSKQLEDFINHVKCDAEKNNKTVQELLPFGDGDTLLFWERMGFRSCRKTLAEYLKDLGYLVELR